MSNIGLPVESPKEKCNDPNCPFHGSLPVRGKIMDGVVVKNKMRDAIIVRRDYLWYVKKYARYERRRSHIPAHLPPCIEVDLGNRVKIAECRPLSKTVSFVVVQKMEET